MAVFYSYFYFVLRVVQQFSNGKYLGINTFESRFNGLILTQNRYDEGFSSDWHYHENPYFAFILKGGSIENRRKDNIECLPGMLLFYSSQERHKNEKYQAGSRNFSIEFEASWLETMEINKRNFDGGFIIEEQKVKDSLLKAMSELGNQNSETQLAVEMLVADMLGYFSKIKADYSSVPDWLIRIKDLLHDVPCNSLSLNELANLSGVHPVTISKLFPRFFGTTIGDYIRGIKLEKSLELLSKKYIPIETIALQCGFSDHAHFSRLFKKRKGFTPSQYREFIFG